ncbi:MAG TPA: flavodoxin domain-containing protein [Gemmatimonadales bacterium]|jgi:menaquinone-dependent protoporphyrinogen oxidase
MAHLLLVYGTSHGHTAKVVGRIGRGLVARGHEVTIWKGSEWPARRSLAEFDGFLVAGSVLYGRHQRYLRDFVRHHVSVLNASPSAFVSVCGAIAGSWEPGAMEAEKYIARFLAQTGWRPRLTKSVAGALPYTRYGIFTRWMMKLISAKTGRPTDTSRDWEFTDWDAVDRFAADLAGIMPETAAGTAAVDWTAAPAR